MTYYYLTYHIDFSEMLVDEEDYIRYMNMIQTFVNTSMKMHIIPTYGEILPAFDENNETQEYIVNAKFKNVEDLQCGLNLLYSFCILNFLQDDPDAKIELGY